jgi:uncharacterized protein (TIGR03435 family)
MQPTLVQRSFLIAFGMAVIVAPPARAQAQPAPPRPAFDVVSIKPSQSTEYWTTVAPMKNGRLSARNITVKYLLSMAYKIDPSRISGGPKWLDTDHFDVEAKCDVPPPDKDLLLMLQSLLADRFQLKLHNETKVASGYALVIARSGPKLRPAEHRDCPADGKPAAGCTGVRFAGRGLTAEYASMPGFVRALAGMLGSSVVDETGLSGAYDFKLEWIRDAAEAGGAPATSLDWIFSALPQQLGLRLEARKTPTEMLIIDGIEKPTAN